MIAWMAEKLAARAIRFAGRFLREDNDPQIIALKRKGIALLRENAWLYHDFTRRLFLAEDIEGTPCPLIDVSDQQTLSWLWRTHLRHLPHGGRPLVIDLGANDGLIGSNSFNLVQLGWNAVLVEPLAQMMVLARENLESHRRDSQTFVFVEAAIGARDGEASFEVEGYIGNDLAQMEGRVVDAPTPTSRVVPMISPDTLMARPDIAALVAEAGPLLLSVDIEGQDAVVTTRLLELGLKPDAIIVETVHAGVDAADMARYGYEKVRHIGWNDIYLRRPSTHGARM